MNKTRTSIMCLSGLAGLCLAAGQASALDADPPDAFGGAPVTMLLGNSGGFPTIAWQQRSGGPCFFTTVGNELGLFEATRVFGSSGGDDMRVVASDQVFCGVQFTPLLFAGHDLAILGEGGEDQLFNFTGGGVGLHGGAGNDRLFSFAPVGFDSGNAGDDVIFNLSMGVNNTVVGESGNDCMHDANGVAFAFDCGRDNGRAVPPVPVNEKNCHAVVDSCAQLGVR
jgi:hypothetical protein